MNPPEDWLIFENTHEAIVDAETWELAQKLRKTPRRHDTLGEANPLTGLLYCADCGEKMYNHRSRGGTENNPVLKIDATFETLEAAERFMKELDPSLTFIPAGGYTSTFGAKAGEMMMKGVSKGAAIKDFMESIGEPIENAYAFGDSANDIEMLEMAGTAIAMGNGAELAKAVADYVTDTVDNDGLYNAMRHYKLI